MKKYVARLLVFAMLLTLAVLPLSSCSEVDKFARLEGDERAVAFYQMVETKTNEATSAQAVQKMALKLDIGDVAYEQVVEGSSTYIKNGDELTYLEQTTSTVWVGGEKIVTYEDEGYDLMQQNEYFFVHWLFPEYLYTCFCEFDWHSFLAKSFVSLIPADYLFEQPFVETEFADYFPLLKKNFRLMNPRN